MTKQGSLKLLVCDLDGTLLGPMYGGLDTARETVEYCQAQGIKVTVATGRVFGAAERYLAYLNIDQPAIANGGALIAELGKSPIYEKTVDKITSLLIAEELRQLGYPFYFLVGKHMYTEFEGPETQRYSQVLQFPIEVVSSVCTVENCPTQIVVRVPPEDADTLLCHLDSMWHGVTLLKSLPHLIEIQPVGVSKSNALAFLSSYMGIRKEDILTVGDGLNDLDMLMWSGMKGAVSNAQDVVKKAVPYVSKKPYAEGVKDIVEKFIKC